MKKIKSEVTDEVVVQAASRQLGRNTSLIKNLQLMSAIASVASFNNMSDPTDGWHDELNAEKLDGKTITNSDREIVEKAEAKCIRKAEKFKIGMGKRRHVKR